MSIPLSFRLRLAALGLLLPTLASAQTVTAPAPPSAVTLAGPQWYLLDPQKDGVMGVSALRAYAELLQGRTSTPVTVAIIDAGIDTAHTDLKRLLWRNTKEIAGNGQDDDQNGYVDDVHGWSFLGGPDGRNVDIDTYEDTRVLARLQPRFQGKTRATVPAAQRADYDLYLKAKKTYDEKVKENTQRLKEIGEAYTENQQGAEAVKQALKVSSLDTATLHHPPTQDPELLAVTNGLYQNLKQAGYPSLEAVLAEIKEALTDTKNQLDYSLNLKFDPRGVVQDHPNDVKERRYGNKDLYGPEPSHGTHVAGIIGADRTNALGILGLADNVRLMAVRAVPNGDERDKDVANAIRYAVDNGASIINMSFGKYYSPQRPVVEEAIRYAGTKGVLLVHSAGNESKNMDQETQYPAPVFRNGQRIPNMITVGASARQNNADLVAEFSNYGRHAVDVFAPGNQIYSTVPGSLYANKSGTSMAAPVVTGIAAVLKSYFPTLTATQLKSIILQSAQPTHTQVHQPGTKKLLDFRELSGTGGIVNLYRAVELAQRQTAQ
ncbi:Subtilase family protein [Hymenobacter gelipurpurascens]|uniref:Subtilase family protein n=1 Tax=Hymenobacter gelipurpurascens TaxID=89968 RepID=A0A212TMZ7_9BACT|nr:S8 family peptidase [Hymenobacter gelipurpurascens]SNC67216.1 Subtilase family protein [Hymenobacter gelipurpurascens]